MLYILHVVNCFQIIVSLILQTTELNMQQALAGCELLSNYCIFDIADNAYLENQNTTNVVNCFQIIVSLILQTTLKKNKNIKQCCELLSNYCIFDIADNFRKINYKRRLVVNCFQIIVSLILQTTRYKYRAQYQ